MLERETGFEFTLTKKNAVVKMLKCQKVAWGTVQKFKTIQRLEGLRGSKNESEKTAGSAQRERRRARLCLLGFRCELEFFTEGSFQLRDWQSECDRTIWVRPNYTCWKYIHGMKTPVHTLPLILLFSQASINGSEVTTYYLI